MGRSGEMELNGVENGKFEEPAEEEREKWGSKTEFILSCIGYSVGLGNVWRFPYLVYKNGGGAFLIPYIIMLVFCGLPMYYMEVAIGQFFSLGPLQCMRAMCPLFVGIGYAMMMVSFLVSVYYNVIMSWVLFYLFDSFRSSVPWAECSPDWGSPGCDKRTALGNGTMYNITLNMTVCKTTELVPHYLFNTTVLEKCVENTTKRFSETSEYWEHNVLDITGSIGDSGSIRWQLALTLLASWIIVYFCMWKGVKSVGKVVYFTATFPYIVLFILLIRGVTLDGAGEGIKFYLKPDFERLGDPTVWKDAATQLFYSLGVAFGSLLSMASYNRFSNNCLADAITIAMVDFFTSTLAGIVIFSVLGYMAHTLNVPVADVAASGPGLAFIVYPEGISNMPLPILWAILFFFMLFLLGLDSEFAMMECVVTNLSDEYKFLRKRKEFLILGICLAAYLIGLSNVTQGGMYVFNLFDYQTGGVSLLFIAGCEVIAVGWFFGAERMRSLVFRMTGHRPWLWWSICWQFITPGLLVAIFLYIVIEWSGVSYNEVPYPDWAEVVGWMLALASMGMIPLFMIIEFIKAEGTMAERFRTLVTCDEELINKICTKNNTEPLFPVRSNAYVNKGVEA